MTTVVSLHITSDCEITLPKGRVTSGASHVFALALMLTLEPSRFWSRAELQEYLLDSPGQKHGSHSVRQLIYRLRQFGLAIDERPIGLRLLDVDVHGPLDHLRAMTAEERSELPFEAMRVLPAFVPRLSCAFLNWLNDVRDALNGRIRTQLHADLVHFRTAHNWEATLKVCELLIALDPFDPDAVRYKAEALALIGRKADAMAALDQHVIDVGADEESASWNERLRARISKLAPLRRHGAMRGRDSCMALLERELSLLDGAGARMTAIVGQAGIGKTRVVEEFTSRVALSRTHVLRFTCDQQSRSHPLGLFYHLLPELRSMRGSLGANPAFKQTLARIKPLTGESELPPTPDLIPEALRAESQAAIIDLLEAVSSERTCLLVVDDAHLLDDASALILRALAAGRNSAMLHIVACQRPMSEDSALLLSSSRGTVHWLEPLNSEDSRKVLVELGRGLPQTEEHLQWCVREAAGNPFYLQTLAVDNERLSPDRPKSVQTLARSLYSSLSGDGRTVLEACLLLGRLATLSRVGRVVTLSEYRFISTLRELEDNGLIQLRGGILEGPHALLTDSLSSFIPSAVAAMLSRRIAEALEAEFVDTSIPPEVAWAAAQLWIGAGEPLAATHLVRRCARNAAALGEAAVAANLLEQALGSQLAPALRAVLLDEQITHAQAGGLLPLVATALRDRLQVALDSAESADRIREIRFDILEADIATGASVEQALGPMSDVLKNEEADPALRIRAAVRLMVFADIELDDVLAEQIFAWVRALARVLPDSNPSLLRAQVVYHTVFGSVTIATRLARCLAERFPEPSLSEDAKKARNFAAFAFHRLRESEFAKPICEQDFAFMLSHGVLNEALYAASLRTDIAIADGDFDAANWWFGKCALAARGVSPQSLSPNSGFYANAGVLAMRQGRYDEAEQYFASPQKTYGLLSSPRYRAVLLSMQIILRQLRGDVALCSAKEAELAALYERSRSRGEQDIVVEALWRLNVERGDLTGATELLSTYLHMYRRELGPPEASLRHTSAADEAWIGFEPSCKRAEKRPPLP